MNEDYRDPQLDAAYQRASEAEAGRPAASTRAAIMEEAAAAARRRAPASNDSRYLWRAVAGLAVIGVAVLVWRQTDVRMPGEAPERVVTVQAQGDAPAVPAPADVADAVERAPAQDFQAGTEDVRVQAEVEAEADASGASARADVDVPAPRGTSSATPQRGYAPDPLPAAPAPPPPPPPPSPPAPPPPPVAAQESAALGEAPVTARRQPGAPDTLTTVPAPPTARMSPGQATPARTAESEGAAVQLLREHFPAQFGSTQFHRVWLVRDADGRVLLSGELEVGQDYEDMRGQLRGLQGSAPGPWQVRQLRNGAGQLIELAIAEVEPGAPRR